jgi:hypothetical protein
MEGVMFGKVRVNPVGGKARAEAIPPLAHVRDGGDDALSPLPESSGVYETKEPAGIIYLVIVIAILDTGPTHSQSSFHGQVLIRDNRRENQNLSGAQSLASARKEARPRLQCLHQ